MNQQFDALDPNMYGNKTVVLQNFRLLHHIWHDSNAEWNCTLQDGTFALQRSNVGVWFYGPFLSSEQQMHCTQGHFVVFADMAWPVLQRLGWKEVDWRNISMVVSYESATQYDGLHVVGSAMKTMFHLAILYLVC